MNVAVKDESIRIKSHHSIACCFELEWMLGPGGNVGLTSEGLDWLDPFSRWIWLLGSPSFG
jgi:hypothetical protein